MEHDGAMARVMTRALERGHDVTVARTIPRAIGAIEAGAKFDLVVAAYRLGPQVTAFRLFDVLARRWPWLLRLTYADDKAAVHANTRKLAHVIVETAASFDALMDVIDRL